MNLTEILEKHKKWLNGEAGGELANLSRANLSRADLKGADLSRANLSRADLKGATLTWANLTRANLSRADLDFSGWPLWCGSFDVTVDERITAQLAYHFCRLVVPDEIKQYQEMLKPLANNFHRVEECGEIK